MRQKVSMLLTIGIVLVLGCSNQQSLVFYINSYHEGYGSSDDITEGIQETLTEAGVNLEIFYMDTKRQNSPEYLEEITAQALQRINELKPAVIIASDDNAVKYVVAPHFKEGDIPVVFCGVNWSCDQYGLPTANVTGMLEVLPLDTAFITLKAMYPDAQNLTILSEHSQSEQKNKEILDPLYKSYAFEPTYALVGNYSDWKTAYTRANQEADLIFFVTNGAIKNWNEADAMAHIQQTIKTPIFTADDFVMDYAVFGFTKVAKEQGVWASQAALTILAGTSPADIPVTKNQQAETYLNETLAEQLGVKIPNEFRGEFSRIK